MGASGAAETEWRADTSVVCKTAAGADGSVSVQMSVGEVGGSLSAGATYDAGAGSGVSFGNTWTSGGGIMSVRGGGFGTSRCGGDRVLRRNIGGRVVQMGCRGGV